MVALRSAIFNLAFYLNMIVLMIVGLPMMLFGRRGVYALARVWANSSLFMLDRICGLRLEFRGLENIPPGGFILASKHQSFVDTFPQVLNAPDFAIILKRTLTFIPVFGLYLVVSGQIAIDRARGRNALAQIVAQARPILAQGRQIFIYPEGTRRAPGAPPRYKFGVAAIYAETGAPCLPVAVNTGLYWGRRGFLRRPGVAVIEYLPLIQPGLTAEEFMVKLQTAIEAATARLIKEAIEANPALAGRVVTAGAAEEAAA